MMRRVYVCGLIAFVLCLMSGAVQQLKAYALYGHAWGTSQIPYYVNPSNVYVSQAAAISDIQQAASAWNTQSGVNVQLNYLGTTNANALSLDYKNNVFFRNDSSGYIAEAYWWWDSSGRLIDADIVLHQNYQFFAGGVGCSGGYYIGNTVAHEFGHALGLAHSPVDTATMFATSGGCETSKETLDSDDIAGMRALYPPSTNTAPQGPSQLTAVPSSSSPATALALAWVNAANNASGYRVERSLNGLSFAQVAQLGSSATSFTDSGLSAASSYYYRVYAFNSVGNSPYSNMATGQTASFTSPPTAPSSPGPTNGATGVGTSVTLSWSAQNAQAYDIYVGSTLFASNLTNPSIPVTSLASGSTYTWRVIAKNDVGSTTGPTWSFTTKAAKKGARKR